MTRRASPTPTVLTDNPNLKPQRPTCHTTADVSSDITPTHRTNIICKQQGMPSARRPCFCTCGRCHWKVPEDTESLTGANGEQTKEEITDDKVKQVLEFMKVNGFNTILKFLEAYLSSKRQDLKTRVGRFLGSGGLGKTTTLLVNAANLEHTRGSARIKDVMRDELVQLFATVLTREVKNAGKNMGSRLAPQSMTPEVAGRFSFETFIQHFEETAPLLVRLTKTICGATGIKADDNHTNVEGEAEEEEESYFADEERRNVWTKRKWRCYATWD
jgi:hypothetical protein